MKKKKLSSVINFDNNSFLVAAKQLKKQGKITTEQYAGMLRRQTLAQ